MAKEDVLEKLKSLREDDKTNANIDWSDIVWIACPVDMFNALYGAEAEDNSHIRYLKGQMDTAFEFYGSYDPETLCTQCKGCKYCMPDFIHKNYVMPGWLYWACDRDNDGVGTAKPECVFTNNGKCAYYREETAEDRQKRINGGEDHDAIMRLMEGKNG